MAVMSCVLQLLLEVTLRVCARRIGKTLRGPCRACCSRADRALRCGPMGAHIRLCGRLEVELGGERIERRLPGRQGPLVLALLVVNRERPVARDELIDALWPASPPSDPDEALSAVPSKVRQALG